MNRTTAFEALESRTLMSATTAVFTSAVKLDRATIHVELLKLKTDLFGDAAKLLVDTKALKKDHLHDNATLQPLVATLRTDIASFKLLLKGDRLTESSNVLTAEVAVLNDLKAVFADRKNPTALAADKTQLTADRITLQGDEVAGLDQRLTDRGTEAARTLADAAAIFTALPNSGASAKLTADVTAWLTQKGTGLDKITSDLLKLAGDRTMLVTDLNASSAVA